jgi:hypothetical protein
MTPPRAASVRDGRRRVVHIRANISRPLLDGSRARRQAQSRREPGQPVVIAASKGEAVGLPLTDNEVIASVVR